jgi:hypothetical protein
MAAEQAINLMPLTKRCRACGIEKPIEDFSPNKNAKDGRSHVCKSCLSQIKSRSHKHQTATLADGTRVVGLEAYTPRQLMLELKRRGYDGELNVVERKTIRLRDIT